MKTRLYHCWHSVSKEDFCCWCNKHRRHIKGFTYTKTTGKDGLVRITCELSKDSMAYAEGYRKKRGRK